MMARAARFSLLLVAAIVALRAEAGACSCIATGPACESYWTSEYVFDGTVTSIESIEAPIAVEGREFRRRRNLVRFSVHRGWKNVASGSVDVITGIGGGDCGYEFAVGERYLVFGYGDRENGGIGTGICTGTRPHRDAAADLAWLEQRQRGTAIGRVFGTIRFHDFREPGSSVPLNGVRVVLSGPAGEQAALTANGRYSFEGLSPGHYTVTAQLDAHLLRLPQPWPAEIPGEGGCAQRDFWTTVNGRIAGILLEYDGTPAAHVRVDAEALDGPANRRFSALTDLDGAFEIQQMPPGRYIVGVNLMNVTSSPFPRVVHPGIRDSEPTTIVLPAGERVAIATMTLPRRAGTWVVSGVVVGPEGRPMARFRLDFMTLAGTDLHYATRAVTDASGQFTARVRDRETYVVEARVPGSERRVTLHTLTISGSDVAGLRLQLPSGR